MFTNLYRYGVVDDIAVTSLRVKPANLSHLKVLILSWNLYTKWSKNTNTKWSQTNLQVILDQSGPPDQLKLKTAKDLGTYEEFQNKTWLYEFKGEVCKKDTL